LDFLIEKIKTPVPKGFFETGDKTLAVPLKLRQSRHSGSNNPYAFTQQSRETPTGEKTLSGFRLGRDGHLKKLAADSHQPSVLWKRSFSAVFVTAFLNWHYHTTLFVVCQ